ncbi:Predicted oxidoreductase [Catalinimonas alkaloidigena]|uniref:Predicted oxidoreductase n=1 Tax=Catalinimonas alkaloidigena TaxID=1075417 RepID=A0A1G9IQM3_9BACT|nr:aldo/keto reductase [Catalinimonas alkaloidigena]SDL27470.1 Predicted oxidoreductase [Catalinimonas alkaloidigena]
MHYRTLGKSDLAVSAITFGAWAAGGWMWGGNDRKDAIEAIQAAYDLGVTSIDTAPIYGMGNSEEIVGEAIKGLPRDQVQLLTKYGMRWDLDQPRGDFAFKTETNEREKVDVYKYASRDSIRRECENSLRRLGVDYIDLYQIHWPDSTTPIQETMETVAELIKEGKIRYAGVSNYSAAQLAEAQQYVDVVSNQVPYSMVKRDIETELVPYCLEHQTSILAYSPLQRGLLTGKMKPGYEFGKGDHRAGMSYFTDENLQRVNAFLSKIKPLADEKGATLSQLVIRWTIEQPGITVALVGARNRQQAEQNAQAQNLHLSSEELNLISEHLEQLELAEA